MLYDTIFSDASTKGKKKCYVCAYQSDKKKQNPLATANIRATDVHSKT